MLPQSFTLATFQEMAGVFGESFARDLTAIEMPGWHGPFHSAYGTHLVKVTQVEPGHPATLAEVRGDVRLDSLRDQRQQQNEQFYQELRDGRGPAQTGHRYNIIVDKAALKQAVEAGES